MLDRLDPQQPTLETGEPLASAGPLVSANAYLGIEAMLPALDSGADIIITGRVADPSLALAPLAHRFGWSLRRPRAAWRAAPSSATCSNAPASSPAATTPIPARRTSPASPTSAFPSPTSMPTATRRFGKVEGTGGRIDRIDRTEQLLYEVTDPAAYLTPDVSADFSGVAMRETAPDRVAVTGGRGSKRPDTLKVSVGYQAGYVGEGEIGYAGENCVGAREARRRDRAANGCAASSRNCASISSALARCTRARCRTEDGCQPYEVRLRVAGRSGRRDGRASIGEEVEALCTNGPAGGGGARKTVTEQIGIVSCLIARDKVRPQVTVFDA